MTALDSTALQGMSRTSPLHLREMRATFRDGGLVGLGQELDALLPFERDNAAAALALGGKMTFGDAQRFVNDAVAAWHEHTDNLRDEADAAARADVRAERGRRLLRAVRLLQGQDGQRA